jgi:anti-anti-sigma factor
MPSSEAAAGREAAVGRGAEPRALFAARRQDEWALWSESDGVLVGAFEGSIEAVAVEKLDREMEARLESKPVFVLLDLGGVDYISSTGWGLIAKYRNDVRKWGGSMTLCRMRPELHEIFSLLELNSIIEVYATVEEALEAFRDSDGHTAMRRPGKDGRAGVPPVEAKPPAGVPSDDGSLAAAEDAGIDEILARSAPAARSDVTEKAAPAAEVPAGSTSGRPASKWRTEDLDILDDVEDLDVSADAAAGAAEEAGIPGGFPRLDTGSAIDGERLAEDKKIRDLGWARYGERLKKKLKKTAPEGNDEGLS